MAVRIQIRRGTAAQWAAANPNLAAGEVGYETDTGRLKVGNGTDVWTALEYYDDRVADAVVDSGAVADAVTLAIADDQTVIDAAAAAVDANPTIATHTAAIAPLTTPGADGEVLTVVSGVPDWAPPFATTDAFDVVGNGTNQTAELRTALEAARDHATKKTVRILGTVLVDWHPSASQANAPCVYPNCTLEGVGYSSCIKYRAATITTDDVYYGIRYNANAVVRYLRFDGDRGAVDKAARTQFSALALKGSGSNNPVFDHLWIHDVPGKVAESFTILSGDGELGACADYLWTWDNDGTGGYHPTGFPTGGVRGGKARISNLWSWNNGWQGMSMYGADRVEISNSRAWNNRAGGFNTEWSTGVDYINCIAHHNDTGGFISHGAVDMRLFHPVSYSNGDAATGGHEIVLTSSTYSATTAVAGSVEVVGGSIVPTPGQSHIWYVVSNSVTTGASAPRIRITNPDAHIWKIAIYNGGPPAGNRAGVMYVDAPIARVVTIGALATWTASALVTTAAYLTDDREGTNAVTLSMPSQFKNIYTGYHLLPTRRYLVRMRIKPLEAKPWQMDFLDSGSVAGVSNLNLPFAAVDVNQWFTIDTVVAVGANALNMRFINPYAGANSLVVDYVAVYELPSTGASE